MGDRIGSAVVIGAGPAGLTAAYQLMTQGIGSVILEQSDQVGGISRTELYKGYRFDIGGHRFYTKVKEVESLWHQILGDEFIQVPRLSRIYYQGKFFRYPLEPFDALRSLGFGTSFSILASYLKAQIRPRPQEENFEDWVINRFGERLYRTFFKTYTEKVWGIACTEIRADWAAQRIKGLSLGKAVINALVGSNDTKTLIKSFTYPILGPGQMWERFQQILEQQGSPVQLNTRVSSIERRGTHIERIWGQRSAPLKQQDHYLDPLDHPDHPISFQADTYISSMPLATLIQLMDPPPPEAVLRAAQGLRYRDFLIVPLIIRAEHLFPDNWIYIHSPDFRVGRIQNFKNWSPAMVPDPQKTCLGLEYFCNQGEPLWQMDREELVQWATQEIVGLGLVAHPDLVEDGTVIRQPKAYPVYDGDYRQHLAVIQQYLQQFDNLQTIGRNGLHRYNNQDHSMLTGMLAVDSLLGTPHDLWQVNTERSYYEDFTDRRSSVPDPLGSDQPALPRSSYH